MTKGKYTYDELSEEYKTIARRLVVREFLSNYVDPAEVDLLTEINKCIWYSDENSLTLCRLKGNRNALDDCTHFIKEKVIGDS